MRNLLFLLNVVRGSSDYDCGGGDEDDDVEHTAKFCRIVTVY